MLRDVFSTTVLGDDVRSRCEQCYNLRSMLMSIYVFVNLHNVIIRRGMLPYILSDTVPV